MWKSGKFLEKFDTKIFRFFRNFKFEFSKIKKKRENFKTWIKLEEPVFTYEDPDLLSQNGTIGGEIMNDFPFK